MAKGASTWNVSLHTNHNTRLFTLFSQVQVLDPPAAGFFLSYFDYTAIGEKQYPCIVMRLCREMILLLFYQFRNASATGSCSAVVSVMIQWQVKTLSYNSHSMFGTECVVIKLEMQNIYIYKYILVLVVEYWLFSFSLASLKMQQHYNNVKFVISQC